MPSSRPNAIPTTVHVVRQLDPASILDVGVGFGKWGLLFREYTDVRAAEADPDRYRKQAWKVRIDGVEGFPEYLTPVHDYVYDRIHVGLIQDLVDELGEYDVVHVGDMIEHLPKAEGMEVLEKLLRRARKALIVSTPKYDTHQADSVANDLERHRSVWTRADFRRLPGAKVVTVDRTLLIAVAVKPGVPMPRIRPALSGLPGGALGLWLKLPELLRRGVEAAGRRFRRRRSARPPFPGSEAYWRARYASGRDSGRGSRGELAATKADFLNRFVAEQRIASVIELGCGDGQQLELARYPRYLGLDVSAEALRSCRGRLGGDPTKQFGLVSEHPGASADLALSLDVVYHLVEDSVFEAYMARLFDAGRRFVIVYSSNSDRNPRGGPAHVRHRRFTDWVASRRPDYRLVRHVPNPHPHRGREGSFADFFVFARDASAAA